MIQSPSKKATKPAYKIARQGRNGKKFTNRFAVKSRNPLKINNPIFERELLLRMANHKMNGFGTMKMAI
jgi:hypothetical protein